MTLTSTRSPLFVPTVSTPTQGGQGSCAQVLDSGSRSTFAATGRVHRRSSTALRRRSNQVEGRSDSGGAAGV